MESNEDTAVQDFLEILEEHRKNCERQGKYVEAEIAKNRLEELRLHEENRRRVIRLQTIKIYWNNLESFVCRRRCDRGKSLNVWV